MTDNFDRAPERSRPTHVRWHMMALVTATVVLTYLDRLNLSIAGKYIQDEFAISLKTMGWILSAFLLGYALSQIPGGYLADRYGPRKVLVVTICWWSVLTAATALAPQMPLRNWFGVAWSFAIVRFLIGIGEAPSIPGYTRVVSAWLGDVHRGFGSSFTQMGIGLGGALTPVLITFIMRHWGWRSAFYVCGSLGIVVAFAWHRYATDRPEDHAGVNAAELGRIRAGRAEAQTPRPAKRDAPPWGKMLSSVSVLALVIGYFCQGFPIYFYHTWFFIYLVRARGFSLTEGGIWGTTPYLAIAILAPIGGSFSDFAAKRLGKKIGRKVAVWLGMFCSAALLWAGGHAGNKVTAILLLAAAAGFNMFGAATFWAACIDLSERSSASLAGLMNTFGNLGGWLSPIVTAYVATNLGWTAALTLASVVTLVSGLSWIFIDTTKPLTKEA